MKLAITIPMRIKIYIAGIARVNALVINSRICRYLYPKLKALIPAQSKHKKINACRLMPKPNKPPAINATITLKHSNDWAKLGLRIE